MEIDVVWLQFAIDRLRHIYIYYTEKADRDTAQKITSEIVDATAILSEQPNMGVVEPLLVHHNQKFSYIIVKNYKIVYWLNVNQNRVEIANVYDVRQNPVKIKDFIDS